MKPFIFDTTLLAVDCTPKAHLALRAIEKSLEQCEFPKVKLLTDNMALKYAVKIPKIEGLEGYSKFCIKDMARYIDTPFALVIQSDGYILNGAAWTDSFYGYDYIGAPFNPSGMVGNGGFSLRSKRLMDYMASKNWDDPHPEDSAISSRHKKELEAAGFEIAPYNVARNFSMEGRSWNSVEWQSVPTHWNGEFGFHSLLTQLPKHKKPCNIFHHSGDAGDIIYSLPAIKAIGGGALFLSVDNKYPYPLNSRWGRTGGDPEWVNNLKPLLEAQDYIERVSFTHGTPFSTDYDLNKFREAWKDRTAKDFHSIKKLHCDAFGVDWPDDKPWLEIKDPIVIPGKPICISRSQRYQSDSFRWDKFLNQHSDKCVFVGTDLEAELIQGICYPKKIYHHKTKDLLEAGRIIAGAKVCVMNQSAPLAIAHGLCKNVIAEEWNLNRNTHLVRHNAIYPSNGLVEIPGDWLQ